MKRNIVVTETNDQYVEDLPVEIVERKGLGHPDSLCDGMAEKISLEYCDWCEENLGVLLHHNFDKVQLVAGEVEVAFGGGVMIRPIRIQIAGRATPIYQDRFVPIETIAIEAARSYLEDTLRYLDPVKHVVIDCYSGRGASALASAVSHVEANDTSFGVSHWPRSSLENNVYETSNHINHNLIDRYPIGEDIKVMGCRAHNRNTLTVAVPFLAEEIRDKHRYIEIKDAISKEILEFSQQFDARPLHVWVNAGDNEERESYYLTLTGTSAECGDDGAVGRGNRANGLIAPFRPASVEASCGKNPISHAGKIYNILACMAAREIVAQVPVVKEAVVYLLSQIGRALDQPLVASALIRMHSGRRGSHVLTDVRDILDGQLTKVNDIRDAVRRGDVNLF